jgi:hypothetical protein
MALDHPLARAALREVTDLHAFFEAWLGGTVADTDAVFSRVERALGDGFTMVSPGGARLRRPDVIGWLRGAHGSRDGQGPFRIAAVEPELLLLRPPLVIVGYVEEQAAGGEVTRRRSTAVFEAGVAGEGPVEGEEGVRWLALHETWIGPGS